MKTTSLFQLYRWLMALVLLAPVLTACEDDDDDDFPQSQLSQQDLTFAARIGQNNETEIVYGNTALQRSSIQGVRSFAQQMVRDHTVAQLSLDSLLRRANSGVQVGLDPFHQNELQQLQQMTDPQISRMYALGQVRDHQKALRDLQGTRDSAQHQPLRDYAIRNIPIVQMHLMHAEELSDSLDAATGS